MFSGLSNSCEIGGKRGCRGVNDVIMESPLMETLLNREHEDGAVLFAKLLVDWGKIQRCWQTRKKQKSWWGRTWRQKIEVQVQDK
jgi:hypothetical protein